MMKPVLVKLIRCSEEVSFCGAVRAASKSTNTALAAGLVLERLPDQGTSFVAAGRPAVSKAFKVLVTANEYWKRHGDDDFLAVSVGLSARNEGQRWPTHRPPILESVKVLSSDFPKTDIWDVPYRARLPLFRSRCSILGLLSVEVLRMVAARIFPSPGGLELTAQILTSAANSMACVGSLPVFASQSLGVCVNRRCLGSLLTLILTSSTCTWGAIIIDIFPGGGWKRLSGHPLLDEGAPSLLGFLGVWECLLLASVSLQTALCLSAWTFYRLYRELGLYPPEPRKGRIHAEVSALEFVCEAEDVALLSDQCNGNCQREPLVWGRT
ncbi:unnamed protein product, partial [Symbiodinium pilosum]